MTNILDQVAKSSFRTRYGHVSPQTPEEFLALRLAHKLGDSAAAQHYVQLTERYSDGQLLTAYRRAQASGDLNSCDRRFHVELKKLQRHIGSYVNRTRLCAIRVERRAIAIAILNGERLEFVDGRHLATSQDKAIATVGSFIGKTMATFAFESAALEEIPQGHDVQRTLLQRAAIDALSESAVGLWIGPKADIMAAFGYPPPVSRRELREVVSQIYPVLNEEPGRPWTLDAAALGLYVQTERLFNINALII